MSIKKEIILKVYEVVGSNLCVASEDGQKVHDQIAKILGENRKGKVSFLNVTGLTSAFLNTAIGQLYGEFSEEKIKSSLKVSDIEPDDLHLLKRVVETAKEYFKDTKRFQKAKQSVLGSENED